MTVLCKKKKKKNGPELTTGNYRQKPRQTQHKIPPLYFNTYLQYRENYKQRNDGANICVVRE